MIKFWAGFTACLVGLCAGYGLAARNASGTFAKLYTFSAGSVINSSNMNSQFSDFETEMSDSLSRSGKGGMTAALRGTDGTVTAPAFAFTSETGTGLYRIGSSDLGVSINQSKQLELTSTLFTVVGTARFANGLVGTPAVSFTNDTGSGLYRVGSNDLAFAVNGSLKTEWNASGFGIGAAAPHATSPLFAIGTGSSFGVESKSGTNTRLASNTYYDGANDKYNATGFASILQLGGLTDANFAFLTAPSGTAGNNVTFTQRLSVNESGVTIGASGTTTAQLTFGSCTLNGGTPASCTATVASGAKCVATIVTNVAANAHALGATVAVTTLTIVSATNGDAFAVNYVCF